MYGRVFKRIQMECIISLPLLINGCIIMRMHQMLMETSIINPEYQRYVQSFII